MYEMYEDLNDDAKEYFLLLLDDKVKDSELLKRCKIEVNILISSLFSKYRLLNVCFSI